MSPQKYNAWADIQDVRAIAPSMAVGVWMTALRAALFFVVATPFELEMGSGYSLIIRFGAAVLLLTTLWSSRFFSRSLLLIFGLTAAYLLTNIFEPNQRMFQAAAMIGVGALLGAPRSSQWAARMEPIVRWYIIIHGMGLLVVLSVFYLSGILLDLHGIVFPNSARIQEFGAAARLAGFHMEPGSYSQWIMMAVFFHSLIVRRLLTTLHVLAALTVLSTFSLWGVVGAAVFFASALFEVLLSRKKRSRIVDVGGSAVAILGGIWFATTYMTSFAIEDGIAVLQSKQSLTTASGLDKVEATNEIVRQLPNVMLVPGPVEPGFCPQCLSPNDVGVWANSLYYFGCVFAGLILVATTWSLLTKGGPYFVPLLGLLLVWKAPYYDVMLWMMISYMLHIQAVPRFQEASQTVRSRARSET